MTNAKSIIPVAFLLFIVFGSLLFILSQNSKDVSEKEEMATNYEFIPKILPPVVEQKTGSFIPDGWIGIPISYGNDMYIDPKDDPIRYKAAFLSLKKKFTFMSSADWGKNDKLFDELATKYEGIIGWNGILDAMYIVQEARGLQGGIRDHSIGELIMAHATNRRYAVEISSPMRSHQHAPLHGAVWGALESMEVLNVPNFLSISEELCGWKYEEGLGNIWISCVHGIGHGLGNIFGTADIQSGLEYCNAAEDKQFQFTCATGIYMSLESEYLPKSFHPCDTNLFPGACYRFKDRLFYNLFSFSDVEDPCSTQSDEYHRVGCIWGWIHTQRNATNYHICDVYLPSPEMDMYGIQAVEHATCIDGFLASTETVQLPFILDLHEQLCESLQNFPLSYEACIHRKNGADFTKFTFTKDSYYYNVGLLEKYKDGNGKVEAATWQSEWLDLTLVWGI